MNKEQLKEYEPFFGGYFVCNEINRDKNVSEFRVKKQSPVGHEVQYAILRCYSFPCKGASSVGIAYPAKLRRLIADTEMMMKLQNCRSVVKFYTSSVIATEDGFEFLVLTQDVFPLHQITNLTSISKDETYSVISAVCDAVSSFRSIGISHKRICPENIFVDSDGRYYLGDFGIGSTYIPDEDYISPEEYNVSDDFSAVDIYQTGMLFYKLLNKNRGPFLPAYPTEISEENRNNALMRRMNGEELNISPDILAFEEGIIRKACAFDISERYRSIASFKSDIDALIGVLITPGNESSQPSVHEQAKRVIEIKPEPESHENEPDEQAEIFIEDLSSNSSDSKKLINALIASIVIIAVIASCLIAYSIKKNREIEKASQTEETSSSETFGQTQTLPTTAQTTLPSTSETVTSTSETVTSTSETVTLTYETVASTETTVYTTYPPTEIPTTQPTTLPVETTVTTTAATTKAFTVPETVFVDVDADSAEINIFDDGERIDEIVITFEAFFGSFITSSSSDVLICEYNSGHLLRTCYADTKCMYDNNDTSKLICDLLVPEDFVMDFENCTYRIVFEKGTITGFGHSNNEFAIDIDSSDI